MSVLFDPTQTCMNSPCLPRVTWCGQGESPSALLDIFHSIFSRNQNNREAPGRARSVRLKSDHNSAFRFLTKAPNGAFSACSLANARCAGRENRTPGSSMAMMCFTTKPCPLSFNYSLHKPNFQYNYNLQHVICVTLFFVI